MLGEARGDAVDWDGFLHETSSTTLGEAAVEGAALGWLETLGWRVAHGPDIGADTANAERNDYEQAILDARLRSVVAELNPSLPSDALEDALLRLIRPAGATLEARNRNFHRILVDGVTVEYVAANGAVRGALVHVVNFDAPEANDWLSVNQFTVVQNKHEPSPDIVLFVNGLPLPVIELKNPTNENVAIRLFDDDSSDALAKPSRSSVLDSRGRPFPSAGPEPFHQPALNLSICGV